MSRNRSHFLDLLDTDDRERGRLVEALRASAAILDGSSPWGDHLDEVVGLQLAPKLRDMAQRLCDHARISSDGTCRYCDVLLDTEQS